MSNSICNQVGFLIILLDFGGILLIQTDYRLSEALLTYKYFLIFFPTKHLCIIQSIIVNLFPND